MLLLTARGKNHCTG